MVRKNATNEEIRREGLAALLERLGPAGTIRFLQQYEPGSGDYTKERHDWLDGLSVDDIVEDIQRRRSERPEPRP
jgi:hypothetical protein